VDDLLEFLLMMEAYRLEEARSYIEDDFTSFESS